MRVNQKEVQIAPRRFYLDAGRAASARQSSLGLAKTLLEANK
jgi:hypothetical protein